jgi:hypothetical protein
MVHVEPSAANAGNLTSLSDSTARVVTFVIYRRKGSEILRARGDVSGEHTDIGTVPWWAGIAQSV